MQEAADNASFTSSTPSEEEDWKLANPQGFLEEAWNLAGPYPKALLIFLKAALKELQSQEFLEEVADAQVLEDHPIF